MTDDEMIGSREACRILDIDRATLSRWVRDGRLPHMAKLPGSNGAYVFRRRDVEQLHTERESGASV